MTFKYPLNFKNNKTALQSGSSSVAFDKFKHHVYSLILSNHTGSHHLFLTLAWTTTSAHCYTKPNPTIMQISQPFTLPVHFPPVEVLKVTTEHAGGFILITHIHTCTDARCVCTHTHARVRAHTHTTDRHHTHTDKSMQINPQAEPCYSINVSAPVISALVRSVSDDLETTSPFNWCHAPLLLGND